MLVEKVEALVEHRVQAGFETDDENGYEGNLETGLPCRDPARSPERAYVFHYQ